MNVVTYLYFYDMFLQPILISHQQVVVLCT